MFESRFQTFVALGDPSHGAARVSQLRAELAKRGLAGFIVPRADEHQNEYVPANAERLRWLTGFAGSAGIAVVLKDAAALFVDGRYTEQVKTEADASVFEFRHVPEEPPTEWIARHLKPGDKLGYDPRLHTPDAVARYAAACEKAGAGLIAVDVNPIDAIWLDRPPGPLGAITLHKLRFAGESVGAKITRVRRRDGIVAGPSDQRSSQSRLAVQYPRLRRLLHAAADRLGLSAGAKAVRSRFSTDGSSRRRAASVSLAMPTCSSPTRCSPLSRTWAGKACASPSTPRPRRPI